MRRSVRERGVHLDAFKFGNKALIREEIENDLRLNAYLVARANQTGESLEELRRRVDTYVEEIIPAFNLLSYYKLGFSVASLGVNFLYSPLIDRRVAARPGRREDVVIYMANHRSNMDYVLVSYMLAQNIAVSYAVGEWARVFPLELLFKSFGSYFVRRGEKDPLYHLVLELYVQLISQRAVSQGIFPEGGLSRDGALRPPKVGLLDAIARITLEDGFRGDVIIVPVGINYDHVLEDRVLTAERRREEKPSAVAKLFSLGRTLARLPVLLAVNGVRTALGRIRMHGYAAVSFGAPISVLEFLGAHGGKAVLERSREERRPILDALAQRIMHDIAAVIPVTPVPLLARVLLAGPDEVRQDDLEPKVKAERAALREKGARIMMGKEFAGEAQARSEIAREVDERERRSELVMLEEQLLDADEAARTLQLGLMLMQRRKIVRVKKGVVRIQNRELLEYYARSVMGP
ncbi:MAG: 1-acyl-sn-glycerol-3-phosphate acyltransferase [Deltaproteobacteria bacterium]|nr:1-acyl-sn-glycerol-3-phosphate acyltransferase [Deltaproteobacteria bacterium]